MCPKVNHCRQSGFALPAAIFVLVVVAAIVAAMVRLGASQSSGVNLNLLGTRAYWAAMSGLEWGIYQVSNSGCFAATTLTIRGYDVQLQCVADPFQEAGSTSVVRYQVSAIATTSGQAVDDADYVYRAVQVEMLIKVSG